MILARVIGRVVSVRRAAGLDGVPLQFVQPLDETGKPSGGALVAADAVESGIGDLVFFVDGREASMALVEPFVPVDAAIVGHVEEVEGPTPMEAHEPAYPSAEPEPERKAGSPRRRRGR